MRAEHSIPLVTKNGGEARANVRRPTIDLSNKVQVLALALAMLQEQRQALWLSSGALNKELALASLAPEAATSKTSKAKLTEAQQRYKDAEAAQAILVKQIAEKDAAQTQNLLDQLKLVVAVCKGDNEKEPEIDWRATDMEALNEALYFFSKGKLPEPNAA